MKRPWMPVEDGWLTPDTYDSGAFASLPNEPGVYLLLCYGELMNPIGVGYVGSAKSLLRRLSQHEVYRLIVRDGLWPQRWFKIYPAQQIREVEKQYIRQLDPAYNIIGRRRGLRAHDVVPS